MSDSAPFEAASRTLKELIEKDVLLGASGDASGDANSNEGVQVSLEVPDGEFVSNLPEQPVINVYLYNLQENLERRYAETFNVGSRSGTSASMTRQPRLVNLNYMISGWSRGSQDNALVEQLLLSRVVQGLGKHNVLPVDMLKTHNYDPGAGGVMLKILLDQDNRRTQGEFWTALGGQPKPAIILELTVPVDVHGTLTTPIVTSLQRRFKKMPHPQDNRRVPGTPPALIISGTVIASGIPDYSSITVKLQSTDSGNPVAFLETRPSSSGFYAFQGIGAGTYVVWADDGLGSVPSFQSVLVTTDSQGNPVPVIRNLTL